MNDATVVDFNLSDVSVFSPENSAFNLVVVSALSIIGKISFLKGRGIWNLGKEYP